MVRSRAVVGTETQRLVTRMEAKLDGSSDRQVHEATAGVDKVAYELHLRVTKLEQRLEELEEIDRNRPG